MSGIKRKEASERMCVLAARPARTEGRRDHTHLIMNQFRSSMAFTLGSAPLRFLSRLSGKDCRASGRTLEHGRVMRSVRCMGEPNEAE